MPTNIIFVVAPRTHLLDLAGPAQVFTEAIFYKAPFEITYCSLAEEAGSADGLRFAGLPHFSKIEARRGDYVFVLGVDTDELFATQGDFLKELYAWISAAYVGGAKVCSVCTGAFVLAAAGLLDGKTCTTHWKYTQKLQRQFPKTRVQENVLFTERDGLLTSAGIASGIDLALHIVERELGAHFANRVAREVVVYIRRDGSQAQHSVFLQHRSHLHAGVHAVQDWLVENLDRRTSLGELAELAHMSTRNFTRIFKKETGATIGDYIAKLRRERIGELLKKPDLSRAQVARHVGLTSERQVGRLARG